MESKTLQSSSITPSNVFKSNNYNSKGHSFLKEKGINHLYYPNFVNHFIQKNRVQLDNIILK
jgi:hypothetical protein